MFGLTHQCFMLDSLCTHFTHFVVTLKDRAAPARSVIGAFWVTHFIFWRDLSINSLLQQILPHRRLDAS